MKNILILIGGWHFPYGFYEQISKLELPSGYNVKKFCVSHRNPENDIVYDEKLKLLSTYSNPLDKILYSQKLSKKHLEEWGIDYKEYPNVIGDYYFIDQYFSDHKDIPDYLFFFHDDNFIKNTKLICDIINNTVKTYYVHDQGKCVEIKDDNWVHISNAFYKEVFTPRGSFSVFKKEILENMKEFLIFDNITLRRENSIRSPNPEDLLNISEWNAVTRCFTKYVSDNNLKSRCYRLSDDYRKSTYLLECERGFIKNNFNMSIDEILINIPDKFQHKTTTSHKFKRELFEFFNKDEFKTKVCLEIGSNIGYTTRVLSYLFKDVIGFNLENVDVAREFNVDRPNVRFYAQDVYNTTFPTNYGDVFLVDAEHTYNAVVNDTMRSLKFKSSGKKYFIYDDYGAFPEIKQAVTDLIQYDKIQIVKYIGHEPGSNFTRPLFDYEGVICIEK